MADPVVGITNGVPTSGTGTITTLGQTLADGANATLGITSGAAVTTDAAGTLQQYLRGLVKALGALTNTTNALDVNIKSGVLPAGPAIATSSAPTVVATDQATLAVAQDVSQLMNGKSGVGLTPLKAKISIASATTTTLVALVAAKKIRVLSMYLVSTGANTVNLQSHTTTSNSDGLPGYAANGGLVLPFNPVGWFDTTAGEALDLVTSGAGQVSGQLTYVAI